MPKVEVYCTETCPYCIRAKALLDRKGVAYENISLDTDPGRRPEMEKRAGGLTSVPQIFIDNFHVGGFDDMAEMDVMGELDEKLGLEEG